MRRATIGSAIAIGVLLLVGLAAEIGLRAMGEAYLHLVRTPPAQFSPAAKIKILCLGDSFTFGIGADGPESYPDRLQARLDARFGTRVCQVLNWGLPAQNSSEALLALDASLRNGLAPDFVLVAIGINNYWNWHLATPFLPGNDSVKKVRAAVSGIRLWRVFTVALTGGPLAAGKLFAPNEASDSRDPWFAKLREKNPSWLAIWLASDLQSMAQLCRERNIPFVLVDYPDPSPVVMRAYDTLRHQPGVIDADNRFFGLPDGELMQPFLSADGWHPNAAGYALVAKNLDEKLAPLLVARLTP